MLVFLLLNEGTVYSLTCYCFGEGSQCMDNNSCTSEDPDITCYLRIVIDPVRDPSFDFGCSDSIGGLIIPGAVCNRTADDGKDEMHFYCCDGYDYCNQDIMHTFNLSPSPDPSIPSPTINVTGK